MMDRQFFILIICSVIAIALVLFGVSQISFDLHLSPAERGILLFRHEKPSIKERQFTMMPTLKNPMESGSMERRGYPSVKLSDIAPPEQQRVSLVLIRGEKRIAIIDKHVVREGDSINDGRIVRIEKGGVLVKNKEGERWLRIQ
jgi:hypothetical protein